jgi:hypothetical protein
MKFRERKTLANLLAISMIGGLPFLKYSKNVEPVYAQKIEQVQQSQQSEIPLKPFSIAEKHHKAGKFDDAREWYRMVVRDFPDSEFAGRASLRATLIDMTLHLRYNFKVADYLGESGKFIGQSREDFWFYDDASAYFSFRSAVECFEKAVEYGEKEVKEIGELIKDNSIFEKRYLENFDSFLWQFTDVLNKKPDFWRMDEEEKEKYFLKFYYNCIVEDVCVVDELAFDKLKYLYAVGRYLYYRRSTHKKGKQKLEKIIKMTEKDPYNEVRYEASKILNDKDVPWALQVMDLKNELSELKRLLKRFEK